MRLARRPALVAAAYLGTFLASLDISIVNVALPTLQTALQTDIAGLQWVVGVYALCLSAFMLSAGPLGDRYGHKRVWMAGVALFTLGSGLCALTHDVSTLIWGRALQGIAGALLIPGAMPILTHAFADPHERARAIGGWSAVNALALILGPLLGGLMLEHLGWQSIFLINLPLGVVALALGAWGIEERKHPEHAALDPFGQLLSVVWLGALTYGLIEAGETGFGAPRVSASLLVALIGCGVFVLVERRVRRPLFPVDLLRNRRLAVVMAASCLLGFACYSLLFFFSLFLQQAQGASPAQTGWRMMPEFAAMAAASLWFGRISARIAVPRLMIVGYALVGVSTLAMASFGPDTSAWRIGAAFAVLGVGAGLAVPSTGLIVMAAAPVERAGIASATMNALRQTGMTLGIAVLGSLMSASAARTLTASLQDIGMPANVASDIARRAVTDHVFPAHLAGFEPLYQEAMASGFHWAMACAGIACLAVVPLLLGAPARQWRTT